MISVYQSQKRRLDELLRRQLGTMGCDRVDLGALRRSGRMMLAQNCSAKLIFTALRWLRRENARGSHIFIRPAGIHHLSLIDDVSVSAIREMKRLGFEPAVIVETSPDNFQVWLNHGRVLHRYTSTLAAGELARRFGGDPSSANWRHFGRLAGFTNQKEKRRLPNGLPPFVKLREASGRTYRMAERFLREVSAIEIQIRSDRENRRAPISRRDDGPIRPLEAFHADPRYGGDLHRADLAWAIHAASRGSSETQIKEAILYGRNLSKRVELFVSSITSNARRQRPSRSFSPRADHHPIRGSLPHATLARNRIPSGVQHGLVVLASQNRGPPRSSLSGGICSATPKLWVSGRLRDVLYELA